MRQTTLAKNNDPTNIFFHRPRRKSVDTQTLFHITVEGDHLRVQNQHVNVLYRHLTSAAFDKSYNKFLRYLNLDFEPLVVCKTAYGLTELEQAQLVAQIITHWIYFYTINNLPIQVTRADFVHPQTLDYVMRMLDKKFGRNSRIAFALGAKILRRDLADYRANIIARRRELER